MSLRWVGEDAEGKGVRERRFEVGSEGRAVPGVLWTPSVTDAREEAGPLPLVLVGHGGNGHKRFGYVLAIGRMLVRRYGMAAAAIDGPCHGDRRPDGGLDAEQVVADFVQAWGQPGCTENMVADWHATLDALWEQPEWADGAGPGPLGYWGLSMGSIFGVPFVASEPRVEAAVLGLLGLYGPNKDRLESDARALKCPVLFLQQWDDELFARDRVLALFDAVGSPDKVLHVNPGSHAAVPLEEFEQTLRFLGSHLGAAPGT